MKKYTNKGFTLIELLMVIGIIGILAGILIPAVGAVKKQANVAASKAQLSNYLTAIIMFKGEYGFFPFPAAQIDNGENVNELIDFMETLSGRDADGAVSTGGINRRGIGFHSFSESEFLLDGEDTIDDPVIADRFGNQNIFIVIDGDGDGEITVPQSSGEGTKVLKAAVTAYVTADSNLGSPDYYLYD